MTTSVNVMASSPAIVPLRGYGGELASIPTARPCTCAWSVRSPSSTLPNRLPPIAAAAAAAAAAVSQLSSVAMPDPVPAADEEERNGDGGGMMKIFVAGSSGNTGRRIVHQLLSKGFSVRAGVRDIDRARATLQPHPNLHIVKADVTDRSQQLIEALGDSEAMICATGFRRSFDPLAPWKVDNLGTVNLVEACRKKGVKRFILISSILVNGASMGQLLNPAYIILNLLGLTLIAKLQAERYVRKSGVNYTIIRPGGLKNDSPGGNVIMAPEDTLYEGSISREQVAEVAVEALFCPESSYKVVEIVSHIEAQKVSIRDMFKSIGQT